MSDMKVIKRDGRQEAVSFDKITRRVSSLCEGLKSADAVRVAQKVVQGVHDGVTTSELDDLAAQTAAGMSAQHPDYAKLAARISISNLHKMTVPSIRAVYHVLADDVREFAEQHREALDAAFEWELDFRYDFFGFKTLERSYLMRDVEGKRIVERPQVMLMRIAVSYTHLTLPTILRV